MGPRALVVSHTVACVLLVVEGDEGSTCRTRFRPLTASDSVQPDAAWQANSQADLTCSRYCTLPEMPCILVQLEMHGYHR